MQWSDRVRIGTRMWDMEVGGTVQRGVGWRLMPLVVVGSHWVRGGVRSSHVVWIWRS